MKCIIACMTLVAIFGSVCNGESFAVECPPPGELAAHLPNPEDCSTFYKCLEWEPHLLHCPDGLWFNPNLGLCDWPANVPEGVCVPPPEPVAK